MQRDSNLRMNSATGKQILSLIRDGDYAHAGEEEAVHLVLNDIITDSNRKILDVGCGLGGTVDLISKMGLGQVTGIDIDEETIQYARLHHPSHEFVCGSALEMSSKLSDHFDLIVMFNAFYTFLDKSRCLMEAHSLAESGAELRIFDYSVPKWTPSVDEFCKRYARSPWVPVVLENLAEFLKGTGWELMDLIDVSEHYQKWYSDLLLRIRSKQNEIISKTNNEWFEFALERYQILFDVIDKGLIKGSIIRAKRLD